MLRLYIATSLDGMIAGPNDSLDWLPQPADASQDFGYHAFYESVSVLLMGYRTYAVVEAMGAWPYAGKPVYVFSHHKQRQVAHGAQLVTEAPIDRIRQLKAEAPGDLWLVGGGQFAAQCHEAGLIDRYELAIMPVILGKGVPLFPQLSRRTELRLLSQETYAGGVLMLRYEKVVAPG